VNAELQQLNTAVACRIKYFNNFISGSINIYFNNMIERVWSQWP